MQAVSTALRPGYLVMSRSRVRIPFPALRHLSHPDPPVEQTTRELAIVPLLHQPPTPEIATDLFHSLGLHGADEHPGRAGRVRSRRLHATYLALAVAFDEEALDLMWLDRGEDAIRIPFPPSMHLSTQSCGLGVLVVSSGGRRFLGSVGRQFRSAWN
jgi:hypothetical protein